MNDFIVDTMSASAPKKRGRPPKSAETQSLTSEIPQAPVESPRKRVRKPFGTFAQKLEYAARPGYHRHWFNDTPGRVQQAIEAGYDHVKDEKGASVSRPVGTRTEGGVLIAYLMEIPQEWRDEDIEAQQEMVSRSEIAIAGGKVLDSQGERQDVFTSKAQGRQTSIRHGQRQL